MEEDRSGLMWEAEDLISLVERGGLSGFGGLSQVAFKNFWGLRLASR
jgi:hypothetical protein